MHVERMEIQMQHFQGKMSHREGCELIAPAHCLHLTLGALVLNLKILVGVFWKNSHFCQVQFPASQI